MSRSDPAILDVSAQVPDDEIGDEGPLYPAFLYRMHEVNRCPLCLADRGRNEYALMLYPEPPLDISVPGITTPHAPLCEDCGDRITDLTHTWERISPSMPAPDEPAYEVFSTDVENCCSCRDVLSQPVLGVELLLYHEEQTGYSYGRHSLCADCAQVFETFLVQLATTEGDAA